MNLRLSLITVLTCAVLVANAQDPDIKRNEVFTKLNSVASNLLDPAGITTPDFAVGYRRYFKNFNLRAYGWQKGSPNSFFWSGDYYNFLDSTITSHSTAATGGAGLKIGIEGMTTWPRKLNFYYGVDAGFGVMQETYLESFSKIYDTTYTTIQERFDYVKPIVSPYIGLRYDISPRFVASIEFAPEVSINRRKSEVSVTEGIRKQTLGSWSMDTPEATRYYTYEREYGEVFTIDTAPLNFWLAFRF